jgi:hypothetical protein
MIQKSFACAIIAVLLFLGFVARPAEAQPITLFWEDFDGYSSFPNQNPVGDPINSGIPKISEGAKEIWYGGRFETPDNGTIDSDLGVQQFGGGSNSTHVGRFADDAGLLFNISTLGLQDVKLNFDYRTFLAESTDRLVAGYFLGNLNLGPCSGAGEAGCYRDFLNQDFGKIDNVQVLATVVPEPIRSILFMLGGGVLTAVRIRKNRDRTDQELAFGA